MVSYRVVNSAELKPKKRDRRIIVTSLFWSRGVPVWAPADAVEDEPLPRGTARRIVGILVALRQAENMTTISLRLEAQSCRCLR